MLSTSIACSVTRILRVRSLLSMTAETTGPTDAGYAALSDIVSKQQRDEMESFVLAETFKYFYLLFAPPGTLDFDNIVFNTEAHPLRRTW